MNKQYRSTIRCVNDDAVCQEYLMRTPLWGSFCSQFPNIDQTPKRVKVCELDDFGLKFGFFESGNKTRYEAILDYLDIKASTSQKKFFLTTLKIFLTFFFKKVELEEKVSHSNGCKR